MKQPIPEWLNFSPESVLFRPQPSRLLRTWWWCLHGLAVASIAVSSLDLVGKCLAVAGVLGHARWRFPSPIPEFAMLGEGCWSVPELERQEFQLAPGSRCGGWWIRLVLVDPEGSVEWILYHDQLPPRSWQLLAREVRGALARLRPDSVGESG